MQIVYSKSERSILAFDKGSRDTRIGRCDGEYERSVGAVAVVYFQREERDPTPTGHAFSLHA